MSHPSYRPFVTCSGVDRFMACGGSATVSQVYDERSEAAEAGTAEHADRLRPGQLPRKVLDWFGGKEPVYEAAMAIDAGIETGEARFLGTNIERGYGLFPGPAWLCGSGDAMGVEGDVLSVGDLKTGRGQASGSLPHPRDSGQLLGLAWMATRLRQQREPSWRPSRVRLMWWLTADRRDDVDDAEVSYGYLTDWAADFRQRVALAQAAGTVRFARGAHCGLCPGFWDCPAQGGAVKRLRGHAASGAMSDADVVAAHLDCQAAEKQVEAVKKALRLRVAHGGAVGVDSTHELRLVQGTQSAIDPNVAAEVLGDRFSECVDVTVSQAGLRRGLGDDFETVLKAIRDNGGVVETPKAPYLRVLRKREN